MYQDRHDRLRKRKEDAAAALGILRAAAWGMRIRSVAAALNRPVTSTSRALFLSATVAPSDYQALGPESLEYPDSPPITSVHAAREGIARWSNVLGGWYWYENEDRFKAEAKERGRVGLREMKLISAIDQSAKDVAASTLRIANNRIFGWLARWAARRGDTSSQETLQRLARDPEGPFRELRVPGLPSFFELLRTPLGRKVAAWRGVKFTEKDVKSLERKWRRSFKLRDERKNL